MSKWLETNLEKLAFGSLKKEMPNEFDGLKVAYEHSRYRLVTDILPYIKKSLPDHSDHGPDHIRDVQNRIFDLLDTRKSKKTFQLSALELYCLTFSALYHDVGNIFGRLDHQKKVRQIYSYVHKTNPDIALRNILTIVTGAHTGVSKNGNSDTIGELELTAPYLHKPIHLRELAAILRFGDELAEGPQRTSKFMQDFHAFKKNSRIYHKYASITSVQVDHERIALTFEIDLHLGEKKPKEVKDELSQLQELHRFILARVDKVDQERKYARHYSEILSSYKSTEAVINICVDHSPVVPALKHIELTDKTVPGVGNLAQIEKLNNISALITKLKRKYSGGRKK